jgi:hypothetical protein
MATASGIEKKLILAPQEAAGTCAVANLATAQYLRRVTSSLDVSKETYQSNEMRADRQIGDFRHGVQSIEGSLSGELSPGTYEKLMAAILRKAWAAGVSDAANSNVAAASTTGAAGTFTRDDSEGSWLVDGFKVGDVVRFTGFSGTGATANNDHNFMITALTATVMTGVMLDGVAVVNDAKGDPITTTVVGKKVWTPITGHTEDWFSLEHYYSDIDLSEVYWDVKVNTMAIKLPATGLATIDFGLMGLNHTNYASGQSPYFSAVLAASTGGVLAAVNGALYIQGVKVALLTGLDFDVSGGLTSEAVVGSNVKPDIFDGRVSVKGNMSVFFEDATFRDYFINETEVSICACFTTANTPKADFLAFTMPRVKVGGASKDDGEKGLIQTMPFVALFDTSALADSGATATDSLATTLSIQDSTLT